MTEFVSDSLLVWCNRTSVPASVVVTEKSIWINPESIRQAKLIHAAELQWKISIQYHSYNALGTSITVLQDHVMAHIRVNVATRFCKGN